jgi:ribosome-associated protein
MIVVPRERVDVAFSRSGGPGGQNVNKTSTKAEVRFVLADADWIAPEVRARIAAKLAARLTKAGEIVTASERHRSQKENLEECFAKLSALLNEAARVERPRKASKPTRSSKRRRLDDKRSQGDKKRDRRGGFD